LSNVNLDWGVETIFPYRDKLFIGTNSGMHILDNSEPANPQLLSSFTHARACDPVVVHENIAYVTLRSGTICGGSVNRLELVDVSNARSPFLIKTYDMQSPAGLSINFPTLYVCESEHGLKVFDVTDKYKVDEHLIAHEKGMEAYDVIYLGQNRSEERRVGKK